jgi:hypothetical protein
VYTSIMTYIDIQYTGISSNMLRHYNSTENTNFSIFVAQMSILDPVPNYENSCKDITNIYYDKKCNSFAIQNGRVLSDTIMRYYCLHGLTLNTFISENTTFGDVVGISNINIRDMAPWLQNLIKVWDLSTSQQIPHAMQNIFRYQKILRSLKKIKRSVKKSTRVVYHYSPIRRHL